MFSCTRHIVRNEPPDALPRSHANLRSIQPCRCKDNDSRSCTDHLGIIFRDYRDRISSFRQGTLKKKKHDNLPKRTLIVIGSGGHGRIVAETAILTGKFRILGFADDNRTRVGKMIDGITVLGSWTALTADFWCVAIGDNRIRQNVFETVCLGGRQMATIISVQASVSVAAQIGLGSVILPGAVVQAGASVGVNAIVNAGAVVDHDARIGDHTHLGLNAVVASYGVVASGEFLAPGAVRMRESALQV